MLASVIIAKLRTYLLDCKRMFLSQDHLINTVASNHCNFLNQNEDFFMVAYPAVFIILILMNPINISLDMFPFISDNFIYEYLYPPPVYSITVCMYIVRSIENLLSVNGKVIDHVASEKRDGTINKS